MQFKKGDKMERIRGGYYIKARKIQESDIAHAPPHVREIWDYLLMMANHKDNHICKRGQHITNSKQVREALHWYVGWRKEMYSDASYDNSMRWLRKAGMITTRRTVRGTVVTIVNYDVYQDPKNYDYGTDNGITLRTSTVHVPDDKQECKERKNIRNKGFDKQKIYNAICGNLDRSLLNDIENNFIIENGGLISLGQRTDYEIRRLLRL